MFVSFANSMVIRDVLLNYHMLESDHQIKASKIRSIQHLVDKIFTQSDYP